MSEPAQEMLKRGDFVSIAEEQYDILTERPHISLWETSPPPSFMLPSDGYAKNQKWYIALNWTEETFQGGKIPAQNSLSDWFLYPQAFSLAIKKAKELNIPALKQTACGVVVLWMPKELPQKEHLERYKMVRNLQKGKGAIKSHMISRL